jgi:hypothetical protein
MGETLNTWMNVSDSLVDASKTMVVDAPLHIASSIGVWSGASQEGMEYTEGALDAVDSAAKTLTDMYGLKVPNVAPGTQVGAMVQGEQWAQAMKTAADDCIAGGQAPQNRQGPATIAAFWGAIVEGTLKCITQAQLHGPISNAGAGFSVGSPFFHVVIIPFGDAKLNPLNQLK